MWISTVISGSRSIPEQVVSELRNYNFAYFQVKLSHHAHDCSLHHNQRKDAIPYRDPEMRCCCPLQKEVWPVMEASTNRIQLIPPPIDKSLFSECRTDSGYSLVPGLKSLEARVQLNGALFSPYEGVFEGTEMRCETAECTSLKLTSCFLCPCMLVPITQSRGADAEELTGLKTSWSIELILKARV